MLGTTLPLGRIAGIRIRAHWSVVFVLAMLMWLLATSVLPATAPGYSTGLYVLTSLLFALCFLGGLLAHELTHAFIARRFGISVNGITLWALGGVAELRAEPTSPKADLMIAGGGPAMSLVIGGGCLGGAYLLDGHAAPLLVAGLAWLGATNLLLAVFNLLPGTPLDGGRVLRSAVWRVTGDRTKAVTVAARCGQALGGLLILAGLAELIAWHEPNGLWLAMIGLFLISSARTELTGDRSRNRLATIRVRDVMDRQPVVAPGSWTVDAFLQQVAPTTRRRAYVVTSESGGLIGLTSFAELTGLSSSNGGNLRIADICRPVPRQVDADDLLVDVLASSPMRPGLDLLIVLENSQPAGVIDPDDLTQPAQRR